MSAARNWYSDSVNEDGYLVMSHDDIHRLREWSENQFNAVFRRTDEHFQAITQIKSDQKVQADKLASQDARFERYLSEQERTRAEILEAVRGHQKREGVKEFLKNILPWLIAGSAALIFVIASVSGK